MLYRTILKSVALFGIILLIACNRPEAQRKIQLSDGSLENESNAQLSTTIYLEEQQRRSLAVLFFQNETGDQNLEWLRQGLTEMFVRALSQSHSLSVLGTDRLYEIAERIGSDGNSQDLDLDMAAVFAKEANVETILTGNITKLGDSLQINVSLHEANEGLVLSQGSVEGPGMENLFAMVDQLTQKLKTDLQVSGKGRDEHKGLADLSTESIDAWRHYTAGMEYSHKLMNAEALAEFQKAIEIDSTFVSAYRMLAMAQFGMNDAPKAMEAFRKAASLRDKATLKERYHIDLFDAVINSDENRVRQVYSRMLEDFPDDVEVSYTLASYYFSNNRYKEALELYGKVLQVDPKHAITLNQVAYATAFAGEFEKAKQVMAKYIETSADEPNPYDSMGEILWMEGDFKKAESYFKKALEKNSTFWGSWEHLGEIYIDLGDYRKAHQVYQDYLEIVPEGAQKALTYYRLGVIDLRMEHTEEALRHFENAFAELDYFTGAVNRTAEVYEKEGQEERFNTYLEDRYEDILKKVDYQDETMVHINALFNLSTRFGLHAEKTLEVLHHFIEGNIRPAVKLRGLFMQTLLELHLGRTRTQDRVWDTQDSDRLIQFLKFSQNFGYGGFFRHFERLNQYYESKPESGILFYNYLISHMVEADMKAYEMGFRGLLADLFRRSGREEYARAEWQLIGMAEETLWRVIGPFDNKKGFLKSFPPEKEFKWDKEYKSRGIKFGWRTHQDSVSDGFINLESDLSDTDWAVGYAVLDVFVRESNNAWLRLGATDPVKVWVNGKELWRFNRYRNALLDDDRVTVSLQSGRNRFLIKICNRINDMGFYFRLTDEKGNGLQNVRFLAADEADLSLISLN